MKIFAFLLVVVLSCVAALSEDELLQKWKSYQKNFGKSYRSPVEARKRLGIFKENLGKIEKHNVLYDQGQLTHTQGINQFTDWTEDEFRQYVNKGLIHKQVRVGTVFNETATFEHSGSIDWREYGVVTPVKNQGQCGSCWSFSATGGIEGQLGMKGKLTSLSEQMLIDCSAVYGNNGCNGGFMTAAFSFVKDNGIMSEQDYPYTENMGICRGIPDQVVTMVSGYKSIPAGDESSLRQAIATIGPISVAVDATSMLQSYSGGILQDLSCNSKTLNHGVLAVGYGVENGLEYYIVKNSWGSEWGESGYFRLGRATFNPCGIASMASYPTL